MSPFWYFFYAIACFIAAGCYADIFAEKKAQLGGVIAFFGAGLTFCVIGGFTMMGGAL